MAMWEENDTPDEEETHVLDDVDTSQDDEGEEEEDLPFGEFEVDDESGEEEDEDALIRGGEVTSRQEATGNHHFGRSKYDPVVQKVLDADLAEDEAYTLTIKGRNRVARLRQRFDEVTDGYVVRSRKTAERSVSGEDFDPLTADYKVFIHRADEDENEEDVE